MKKIVVFVFSLMVSTLLFSTNVQAESRAIASGGTNYATTLSVCAIIFGTLAMAGGIYIMFYNPNKKKKVSKKKDK